MTDTGTQLDYAVKELLKQQGYSEKNIHDIWKWFDFSERKGVANF